MARAHRVCGRLPWMDEPAVKVKATRVGQGSAGPSSSEVVDLGRAKFWATLLDSRFSIAGIKFGIDPIIGLIPAIGDLLSFLSGTYIIYLAWKHQLGGLIIAKMLGNLLIDWLAGTIPLFGDVADVLIKANLRNLRLLEEAIHRKYQQQAGPDQ